MQKALKKQKLKMHLVRLVTSHNDVVQVSVHKSIEVQQKIYRLKP